MPGRLDLSALRIEAVEDVRELIAMVIERGGAMAGRELRVRDDARHNLLTIPFKDVLEGAG